MNIVQVVLGPNQTYHPQSIGKRIMFVCLFAWGLTALSAQTGYIAP